MLLVCREVLRSMLEVLADRLVAGTQAGRLADGILVCTLEAGKLAGMLEEGKLACTLEAGRLVGKQAVGKQGCIVVDILVGRAVQKQADN